MVIQRGDSLGEFGEEGLMELIGCLEDVGRILLRHASKWELRSNQRQQTTESVLSGYQVEFPAATTT